MMKMLVVVALALSFHFLHAEEVVMTLTGDTIQSADIPVPRDYQGAVNFTFYALDNEDVTVCINWLVPAEAPEDVDLVATWNQTCTFSQLFHAGSGAHNAVLPLRTSISILSASLASDVYSDGLGESFQFRWEYTLQACDTNSSGPSCTPVVDINYNENVQVNDSAVVRLPTYAYKENVFLQALVFSLVHGTDAATVTYRLNAPVINNSEDDYAYDGTCTQLSKCTIPIPPFSSVEGFFWEIDVTGNATFKIVPQYCPSGKIGAKCGKSFTNWNKKPGDAFITSGPQSFVFTGTELSVAIGGLDGYDQESVAPTIQVQVDQLPTTTLFLSSGINSKANRLGFSLDGIANHLTRYVVNVLADSKASYGIWIPENTTSSQCAFGCSGQGECSDYVCECNDKYNGIGCEHEIKEFTIEYIILIAVGGLLVLSIVIGVPIYCWMNRQQDYETIE